MKTKIHTPVVAVSNNLGCDALCESCHDDCYQCADTDYLGTDEECTEEKLGYKISFKSGEIIIDLANPYVGLFSKDNFVVTKNGSPISVDSWVVIKESTTQFKIENTLLTKDDLPIEVDLTFLVEEF